MWTALLLALAVPTLDYDWRNVEIVGGGFVTGVIPHPKLPDLVYARTDIGGAYRRAPGEARWQPLMDWITPADWNLYGVESLAVDPSDPNRVYVAAGTYDNEWGQAAAMLSSADQGRTWRRTDMPFKMGGNMPGRSMGERLAVDPSDGRNVWFGSRNSGLWRSRDFGRTWSRVDRFPAIMEYDQPVPGAGWDRPLPQGQGIGWVLFAGRSIYAGVARLSDNLYVSHDDGASWSAVAGQPSGLLPHQAKVGSDGVLTIVYGDAVGPNGVTDGAVWRYRPTDGAWTEVTPEQPGEGNGFGYGGVAVDAQNPQVLMVSTLCRWAKGDTLFRTTDGGKTWVSIKETAKIDGSVSPYLYWGRDHVEFGHWIGDVEIDPHNPDRAWYVTGATIFSTTGLTAADRSEPSHWVPVAEGLEETAVLDLVSPPVGAHVVSALGDIGGFRHDELTRSPAQGIWQNPYMNSVGDLDFAARKPEVFVRVGGQGPQFGAISKDGAASWAPFATQPAGVSGGGSIALSADGLRIVWSPSGAAPHWSSNGGRTWAPCGGLAGGRVVSDRSDPSLFYAGHEGTLWVSANGGSRFLARAKLPEGSARPEPVPGRAGELWVPASGGLYRSRNAGRSLVRLASVDSARSVGFGAPMRGKVYPTIYLTGTVEGVVGVFRSVDQGRTWARINDEATAFGTQNVIAGDPKRFGRVYLGTNGRGVLVADPK